MTRYATTKQEDAQNARLDAFMSGQRAKRDRGEETSTPWRAPVDPLGRFISGALGAPPETRDAGDDVRMSAGYMRLTDRERDELGSASPMVAKLAEQKLRRYASADPDNDPVAAHFVEMAAAAPRATPPYVKPTMPVEEEAWLRYRDEPRPEAAGWLHQQTRLEALTNQVIAERAAAAAEEGAE